MTHLQSSRRAKPIVRLVAYSYADYENLAELRELLSWEARKSLWAIEATGDGKLCFYGGKAHEAECITAASSVWEDLPEIKFECYKSLQRYLNWLDIVECDKALRHPTIILDFP